MKTKAEILKLLENAKTPKEINDIVDTYPIEIVFDYDLMDALRDARARVVRVKTNKRMWEVYELN